MFTPSLVPYLDHPTLEELDARSRSEILTRHLYQYLNFTANLEPTIVNRGVHRIAFQHLPLEADSELRLDALKIYTDEGYHALFCVDLINQVERATQIIDVPYQFTPYIANLDAITAQLLPGNRMLGEILQVVIFETAVSAILSDLPKDPNLATAVAAVVRDHMEDEKLHHAFFVRLFPRLWESLDNSLKILAARALPRLIVEEIKPYSAPIKLALMAVGLTRSAAADVLSDTYTEQQAREYAQHVARYTVALFARTGVLDIPGAAEAFAAEGLLPKPSQTSSTTKEMSHGD